MKAWVYQDTKQVAKLGVDAASWYVGWIDPDGRRRCKSCGRGARGKKAAETLSRKTEGEILAGTYQNASRALWSEFRAKFDSKVIAAMGSQSALTAKISLDTFQRTVKPLRMSAIKTETIDDFVAQRLAERSGEKVKNVSKATVNRELRYVRAALRVAHDWGYLANVPRFKFQKVSDKLPTFIPPEHFAKLYQAADQAKQPAGIMNVTAADWWRGLLMTAYMTGWRIGALLALKWADVDLEAGTALSQADDNKGKRDALVPLHPIVVEHLRKLAGSFATHVFPLSQSRRRLWLDFQRLQDEAGVKPATKVAYGFHDLRRAFATLNAASMDLFELQRLMQHKSLDTTRLYVNMANRLKPVVASLFVPDVRAESAIEGKLRDGQSAALCG